MAGPDNKAPEACALEAEITPAMIEAGSLVVASIFDEVIAYGSETAKVTAKEVYLAMRRACVNAAKQTRE